MFTGQDESPQAASSRAAGRRRADEDVLQLLLAYRKSGDPALRERIVAQFTNLVESIARRFSGASEPAEDLAQEGYIGLLTAIDLYDPAKNVKFSTYATHFVIGQIKHCLRDRGKIIKEPAWLQELNQRMTRAIERLAQELSRPPTHIEIAQLMGMTEEAVAEVLMTREVFKVTSIDGGETDEDTNGTVDMERRQGAEVAVTFQLPVEDRIVLEAAMQKLKELEQQVLTEFYFRDLNQTEIARQLGISCNYVSHLLRNSTRKLKKILITEDLRTTQLKLAQIRKRFDEQLYGGSGMIVDPLTRLYNKAYFDMRLEEEISRSGRIVASLAVLFVVLENLDAFIRANGTLKGDEAVTGAAALMKSTLRRSDIITRYESSMFGIILPYTGSSALRVEGRALESLTAWLEEMGWHRGRAPLRVSTGCAWLGEHGATAAELTAAAIDRVPPVLELRRAA